MALYILSFSIWKIADFNSFATYVLPHSSDSFLSSTILSLSMQYCSLNCLYSHYLGLLFVIIFDVLNGVKSFLELFSVVICILIVCPVTCCSCCCTWRYQDAVMIVYMLLFLFTFFVLLIVVVVLALSTNSCLCG